MRICLIAPPPGGEEHAGFHRLAGLLARDHEVTVIDVDDGSRPQPSEPDPPSAYRALRARPGPEMDRTIFAGHDHRVAAAVMESIQASYGLEGPDYVEVADRHAHGLVALMARRCADPLLARTRFGVRLLGTAGLEGLHDGRFGEPDLRLLGALEREQLRLADFLLWPGGDVLDLYRRRYPDSAHRAFQVALPEGRAAAAGRAAQRGTEGPLRILFVGELRRCAGALDLAEACLRLPVDDWELTMVGADTLTAPGGQSVAMTIEAMLGEDPRLTIETLEDGEDPRPNWNDHDLAVVPPQFAVWPATARMALRSGVPVLATPVGALPTMVEEGKTGWCTEAPGAEALRCSLERLIEGRDEVSRVRGIAGEIGSREGPGDPDAVLAGYGELLAALPGSPQTRRAAPSQPPLVTGVVPYFRGAQFVGAAVRSLLEQTHERIEVLIVNDGSFEPEDTVLQTLAADPRVRVVTQRNRGEAVARNLGAKLARGEYVTMLDADNILEPEFVARALSVFEHEPDLAYVSCWLRFIAADGAPHPDPAGYAALGNSVVQDDSNNWDGDTLALLPRRLFAEDGFGFDPAAIIYSDWEFYRSLKDAGHFGIVIPERLARYRIVESSLQRAHGAELQRRGWDEARGRRFLRLGDLR